MEIRNTKEQYRSPEAVFFELEQEGVVCVSVINPFSENTELDW